MKKYLIGTIMGILLGIVVSACAGGGKSVRYRDFANRNMGSSVWMKCKDGDIKNICKYYCSKYKKNNKCKRGHRKPKKINLSTALDSGYVVMSKSFWIKLLRSTH